MNKKILFFMMPLVVFIVILSMMYFKLDKSNADGAVGTNQIEVSTSTNKPLPTFNLPSLNDSNQMIDNTHLPNTPYMLNIWGSWCIACSREHPQLVEIQQSGVEIVGVNYKDTEEFAKKFLTDYGNPFSTVIYDEMGDLGVDLGVTGAPESFIIDESGIIRQHIVGEITSDTWTSRIQPCITALSTDTKDDKRVNQVCQ